MTKKKQTKYKPLKSEWPWLWPSKVSKVRCNCTNGLRKHTFILMFNSNIWPNSAPLRDIGLRDLSDLDFGQIWWCHLTLHIWFPIDGYSNYMSISHGLALIATQNILYFLISLIIRPQSQKLAGAPNVPKMTLNVTRSKIRHICTTSSHESQISLRFALPTLVFQITALFSLSIGYNDEIEKFEKKKKNR